MVWVRLKEDTYGDKLARELIAVEGTREVVEVAAARARLHALGIAAARHAGQLLAKHLKQITT